MIATCYECGIGQVVESPKDDCGNCGERVGVTCRDCGNDCYADDLDSNRRCEDCAESAVRIARQDKRRADWEAYGDYLRDQQKDGAL